MPVPFLIRSMNAGPFGASRIALVATATVRGWPRVFNAWANRSSPAFPRSIASGARAPSEPTPSPSRGLSLTSWIARRKPPGAVWKITRRAVFDPTSMTATLRSAVGRADVASTPRSMMTRGRSTLPRRSGSIKIPPTTGPYTYLPG